MIKFKKKNLSGSSKRWIQRHHNDDLVNKAKKLGYRSRAIFKLEEINNKLSFLNKNKNIIDLGAAPGSWSQYLSKQGFKNLLAIDILEINKLPNVKFIIGDFTNEDIKKKILQEFEEIDIILSETCALDIIGAKFVREIENGEIVVIDKNGIESIKPFPKVKSRPCVFEYVYFSRPDSIVGGKAVHEYRKKLGEELAKENKIDADLVSAVPDSGIPAAIGYSNKSKIQYDMGIIRNHYIGRTFIEPTQQIRQLGVKLKHNANKEIIKNKKLILIDDSIVRGTTSKKIVDMLFSAGAKEIHLCISSPPIKYPDYYGIDTPSIKDLIAANHSIEEIRKIIGVNTLNFLSIDGLYKALGFNKRDNKNPQFTDHCFTGDYPVQPIDQLNQFEKNNQLSLLSNIRV